MVSKSEAMGLYPMDRASERWHLGRKLILLLLLVLAADLGLVILLRQRANVPLVLFNLLADAGIGVLMGLACRIVLRRRGWLLQAIAAAALSIIGLAILGSMTDQRSGIGPLELQLTRVHWLDRYRIPLRVPTLPKRSAMDLLDAAHFVIAVDVSWITLRAWRRRVRASPASVESLPAARPSIAASPARWSAIAVAPTPTPVVRSPQPVVKQRKLGRPLISTGVRAVRPARRQHGRRNLFRRKPDVQLAVYEEHRCPYCLENVKRNDPRGSVECPICHTLHHKDCWDITGTCQVPHLNS
jgi:hypothetical protein